MTARVLMIQGTGSNVGKSLICAGLCRLFANAGLTVAPFKPQNMSNNAAATADGGEIGRAQALQALAARRAPVSDMNPVLLKPETTGGAQVILQGRARRRMTAREYFRRRAELLPHVVESFARLATGADLVIVEGAGSPAEANLREGDIANMGFATAIGAPVILVGDVHRGGVIAALVGTMTVLSATDAGLVKGFIVNNFHGDIELFSEAVDLIESRTGRPVLGVVPHLPVAARLPAEDSVALDERAYATAARGTRSGRIRIAVPRLARIANFDDLDPLRHEPDVDLRIVPPGDALPGDADVVILPGSKSVRADLDDFMRQGWDIDLRAHVRRGGLVLGICGGYQMLGRRIADPHGLEGDPGISEGLCLLNVDTVLDVEKTTRRVLAEHMASGELVKAYEIHLGRTTGADCERPFARVKTAPDAAVEHCMHASSHRPPRRSASGAAKGVVTGHGWRDDGAVSEDGRVAGTYLHGAFVSDGFRRAWLRTLGARRFGDSHTLAVEATLDELAMHLARYVDVEALLALARAPRLSRDPSGVGS